MFESPGYIYLGISYLHICCTNIYVRYSSFKSSFDIIDTRIINYTLVPLHVRKYFGTWWLNCSHRDICDFKYTRAFLSTATSISAWLYSARFSYLVAWSYMLTCMISRNENASVETLLRAGLFAHTWIIHPVGATVSFTRSLLTLMFFGSFTSQ